MLWCLLPLLQKYSIMFTETARESLPLSGELSKCSTCFLELPNIVVNNVVLIISNASIYHLGLMASNDVIALIWAVYGKIDKDHSGFDVKKGEHRYGKY